MFRNAIYRVVSITITIDAIARDFIQMNGETFETKDITSALAV